jgi:hypothetical protein
VVAALHQGEAEYLLKECGGRFDVVAAYRYVPDLRH